MPDIFETNSKSNIPEYTVSELSRAIRGTLERQFEHVRVRAEISGLKRAASGHLYLALKDEDALLDAVCWRGVAAKMQLTPHDGMEVIAKGRITTYPGRSKYQLVIESMELAGEGAILKMLEERKKRLEAEGLFAADRKRPLPFLPTVIGVVTSPTGSVIRDILHRLEERFPRHVLVWPVLVQGQGAADQITSAIEGFNALAAGGKVPRPDVLIIARGGGSLEDLLPFSEESVVRAVALSDIPVISAVGHETDTMLVDFAADRRAPTPTAAAEMATPVRHDLLLQVMDLDSRFTKAGFRRLAEQAAYLESLVRSLPDPRRLLGDASQRLDERGERLDLSATRRIERKGETLKQAAARLVHPRDRLRYMDTSVRDTGYRLHRAINLMQERTSARLDQTTARFLSPKSQYSQREKSFEEVDARFNRQGRGLLDRYRHRYEPVSRLLESFSYNKTLERGFAVIRQGGEVKTRVKALSPAVSLSIQFADGSIAAMPMGEDNGSSLEKKPEAQGSENAQTSQRPHISRKGRSSEKKLTPSKNKADRNTQPGTQPGLFDGE